jgi:hypothetical protein
MVFDLATQIVERAAVRVTSADLAERAAVLKTQTVKSRLQH